jgi:hypothetical protein
MEKHNRTRDHFWEGDVMSLGMERIVTPAKKHDHYEMCELFAYLEATIPIGEEIEVR